ncbi:ABC transporter ATP-binding protein/permease [Planctomycetota bacterium]|nr:ABC transporter ATP-binding protein/permease [Planctomycetota bacterium]
MSDADQKNDDTAKDERAKPADEYEGRKAFAGGLVWRLLAFVIPHRWLLILALILFPIVAATQLIQPYLVKQAIDGPITDGNVQGIAPYALGFLGLALLQAVLQFAQSTVMQLAGQKVMKDIRTRLFDRVLSLAPSYFDKTPQGKIMTRLTSDVDTLNELLSSGLVSLIADTVLLIGIVVTMLLLDWKLALISFSLVLPLLFAVGWLRGHLRQIFRRVRNRNTALNIYLNESVVGMIIVQAFLREPRNRAEYSDLNGNLFESAIQAVWWNSILSAWVQLAQILTVALLFWVVLGDVFGVVVSVGLVVAFVDYIERFYAPVDNLSGRYAIFQTALAAAEKIFTILDETEELPEPEAPKAIAALESELVLDGVDFTYQTGEQVLHNVTLSVPRGHTVALVGATGAGKSTIVKLFGRFYDPSGGAIRWDGVDVREFSSRELRKRIAYVPQETFLFSDTLAANIALDPKQVTREAVQAAAEAVHADLVAADLPNGYDQILGERGHDLSAGERQLMAFARALARDPDVLILDEATANIDGETEARIQEALERLLEGRTAVVIAHRLSTIKKADAIVVLHKGQVEERGTHDELIAQQGLYWKLYRLQSEEAA